MRTSSSALGLATLLAGVLTIPSAARQDIITPEVSSFVKNTLAKATIPGLSMGLVRLDDDRKPTVELAAWGNKTEEGDGNDLTPDALFGIASCSKAFLATSVGLLIDDFANGKNVTSLPPGVMHFDWDTKLADLLPGEWGLADEWAQSKANFHDLLSHQSGMPRHDFSYRPGDTSIDIVKRLKLLSPAYELREQWLYNNQMFMVGAHLVAKLAGSPYHTFVESRIFAPLHMSSSTFSPAEAAKTGRVTQTWTPGLRLRRIPYWFSDAAAEVFAGPGGITTSAEDMTTWLSVLLNGGVDPLTNTTIIPESTFTEMTTARAIVTGTASSPSLSIAGYGMGWFRVSYRGHDLLYHNGAMPGFTLLTAFLPGDQVGAVLLANMDQKSDDLMNILFRVIDAALGLPTATTEQSPNSTDTSTTQTPSSRANIDVVAVDPLPLNITAYAGSYENAAYGTITFCAPSSTSAPCQAVLAAFAPIEAQAHNPTHTQTQSQTLIVSASAQNSTNTNTLYAAFPRVWSSHVRLQHTRETSFDLVFPWLFPHGFGADTTPFEFHDAQMSVGRVEFAVDAARGAVLGFELLNDAQADAARAERTGGGIREVGDAWFVKRD